LTERERDVLERLEDQARSYKRGTTIQLQQESARDLFIVQSGWLHSYCIMGNGSRQIMRFHYAGDLIGLTSVAFGETSESILAVTDVTLCPFGKDKLAQLFRDHPRIAGLIFNITLAERALLADRLASVGRTSARARVALLICELLARLRLSKGPELNGFSMPFTQEEIGDATGLTAVHVNRMMRGLVDDGLIARHGNAIDVLDEQGLMLEASFVDRFGQIDTSWLPEGC
jgi:CRP/FNR family transcriptional regulator, anaerobic regulatory protein